MADELAQLTWELNLRPFIQEVDVRSGGVPNLSHYLELYHQVLRELFRETQAWHTSWSNASGGAVTLSGNSAALPYNLLELTRVEWDGTDEPLAYASKEWLDLNDAGWRDATGEPVYYTLEGNSLVLDSTPSNATGKLVIRGFGCPDYEDALTYFPIDCQLLPAHGVLAELAYDPEKPVSQARFSYYQEKWTKDSRPRLIAALMARTMEKFSYGD